MADYGHKGKRAVPTSKPKAKKKAKPKPKGKYSSKKRKKPWWSVI